MITFVDVCGEELGKVPGERKVTQQLRKEVMDFAPDRRKLFVDGKECLDGATIPAGAVVVVSPRLYRPTSEWAKETFVLSDQDAMRNRPLHIPVDWLFRDVTAVRKKYNDIVPLDDEHLFCRCKNHRAFWRFPLIAKETLETCPANVPRQYDIVVSVFRNSDRTKLFLAISDIKLRE